MELKACYQALELQVGASREAVEAAYCRLLEKWHPDRVKPPGDVEGVAQAKRMVEIINEAYRTLVKIAPAGASETQPPMSSPAGIRPASSGRPMTAPPPPPPPAKPPTAPLPVTPPPATSAPAPAPESSVKPQPVAKSVLKTPATPPSAFRAYWNSLPPESPVRRFGPIAAAVVVALLLMFVIGKCTSKPSRKGVPDPKTTGRLVIKTNRPDTSVSATRLPDSKSSASESASASGAEPVFAGLPPGKYSIIANSAGWPEIQQDVQVNIGQTNEATVHFKIGSLRLDSNPTGAVVRWGEIELGKTPLVIPALPPGEVQLTLMLPGWPPFNYKTTITEDVQATGTARLPFGRLVVDSTPSGATVQLEAKVVGKTPLTLERVPAGIVKVTLRADDFTPVAFNVTVEDQGEAKLNPVLTSSLPLLDPAALLAAVWVETAAEDPNRLAPAFRDTTGYQSRNGYVRNLNRRKLVENWLAKRFRFSGIVKSYDRDSGRIEFADQNNDLTKFRVTATLSITSRQDKDLVASLTKGATFAMYGKLDAVEEAKWPGKMISIEFVAADPQR